MRDVTDQVRAQQALAASEARYRAIVENADEGIWVAGPDGRTTFANSRMLAITGLTVEEIRATSPGSLFGAPVARRMCQQLSEQRGAGAERYQAEYHHPDGQVRHLSISATPLHDDTGFEGVLALVSDITATRSATRRLEHAAAHDTLTGLPNRSTLQRGAVDALTRSPQSTAVIFIDLDHFKTVNDARGHDAGDDLLREVAQRLKASVRPGDLVARLGGDEFVVVCEEVTPRSAAMVADRLLAAVEEPVQVRGGRWHATASLGIALSPATSAEQLLREADAAMYAAKSAGGRTVRFFDEGLAAMAENRHRLGHDLRAALGEGHRQLAYQPVVDLHTGAVLGAEALEVGFAPELDFWGFRRAARDLAVLRAAEAMAPASYVAVNISARTLDHPGLLTELGRAVADHGLRREDLVLEIAEAALVTRSDVSLDTLRSLSGAGHLVALDDFGTGHSALAHLRDLPTAVLKIDRSFVRDLATSPAARTITGAVVGLAHRLQMRVVADGVEDEAQAAVLRELGCDGGQGWHWSAAVSRDDALADGSLLGPY